MDFSFNYIVLSGIVIIAGFIFGELANKINLPKASGYLVAGLLLNPHLFFDFVTESKFTELSHIPLDMALSVIAFSIGGGLHRKKIKPLGKSIISIGINQAELTLLITTLGMIGIFTLFPGACSCINYLVPMSIVLGSLALPTDPAAFLAVKNELKAEGNITTTTLGIAAIDDMLTFLNFVLAVSIAGMFMNGEAGNAGIEILITLGDILLSIALGVAMGILLNRVTKWVKKETEGVLIVMMIGFILACFGIAESLELEKLLASMCMGIVVVNYNPLSKKIFMLLERYTEELVFVIFFTLSGIQLNFDILGEVLLLVGIFILLRFAGKWFGTVSGAMMVKSEPGIRKYTTWALLPQGGIVIGLALTLQDKAQFSEFADIVLGIVIIASVFYEIVGSITTKYALIKAGEANK